MIFVQIQDFMLKLFLRGFLIDLIYDFSVGDFFEIEKMVQKKWFKDGDVYYVNERLDMEIMND